MFEGSPLVFLVLTVIIGGGAAFLAGRALAAGWRSQWLAVGYMVPMALALRFIHYALFHSSLTSPGALLTDFTVLAAAALLGHRMKRASQMATQYPWLYEATSPVSWREKSRR